MHYSAPQKYSVQEKRRVSGDYLVGIAKSSSDMTLKLAGTVFMARKVLQEMLHLLCTAHHFARKFITKTQIGQHKHKVNSVSLCMVTEYSQFNKEQIQLTTAPDTEIVRKITGAALLC